ncbi:poly(3-hydroxybutyrate) depolymerase [Persephonella sp.]|uniref:portal protein n=1 Tax=Persephonella sp. TaxID=2060922 RepID=UPI00260B9D68|nr:poly(3-hydroxybutyrate) depolymerase [Persephonella sp.]
MLTKEQEKKLLENTLRKIKKSEDYYRNVREPFYIEAAKRYYANEEYQERFGKLAEKSKIVIKDIMAKIEWAMPSIMRLIYGQTDIVAIQGRTPEDDDAAEKLKKLINWQIQRENEGFLVFYRFAKDVMKYQFSVLKVRWERDISTATEEIYITSELLEQLQLLQAAGQQQEAQSLLLKYIEENLPRYKKLLLRQLKSIEIEETTFDEEKALYKAKVKFKRLKKNAPIIENLLPWEFLYIPDGKTINDVSFVAHKKKVSVDYLRKKGKEGFYKNVKEAIENAEDATTESLEDVVNNYENEEYKDTQDESLRQIDLYECYTKFDINNDGILEDIIVWIAGEQILRIEENITGRHPFFGTPAVIESEKLEGSGFSEIIGQLQDLKTALWKQLIINVAKNNQRKTFIDPSVVEPDGLVDDREIIFADLQGKGSINNYIQYEPIEPIFPQIGNVLEMLEMTTENLSGITRYSQGLDGKALNKTATGISMIMQASNQRIELIVRIISEVALRPLFRYLVELNQRYIDQETVIRLTNEPIVIRPDDLVGEFDFVVDTSVGMGTKETQMQAMQIVGQFYPQFVQMLQVFMQYPNLYEKFRNYYKKQLELIGIKAVDEYLPTVEELQQMAQIMMQQQMQAQAMQGALNG